MAHRDSEAKMTRNEISKNQPPITQQPRVSVFDRLGPPKQNPSGAENSRRKENNYPDRRHRGGADGKMQQQNPPKERPRNVERSRDTAAAASTPGQVHIKPNALLHRTLQDVKKERSKEEFVANPSAAIKELERRLQQVEEERNAAEELSNTLLFTQQTLLQDKAKLQAENMRLTREMEALLERLDFLDVGGGDCSPAPPGTRKYNTACGAYGEEGVMEGEGYEEYREGDYVEEQHHYETITPDSGMLKALKLNVGDLIEGDALTLARTDLGEVNKKLEEEIC